MVLAVLYLTTFEDKPRSRAWNDVANRSEIARRPKTMSRITHTIDVPDPRLRSFVCAPTRFLLAIRRFANGPNRAYKTTTLQLLYQPNVPNMG